MADVVTTGEAREALHKIAKRFDAGDAEPVYFGSHRRAQGVIVPLAIWERLLEHAQDEVDMGLARDHLSHDNGQRLTHQQVNEVFDQLRGSRATQGAVPSARLLERAMANARPTRADDNAVIGGRVRASRAEVEALIARDLAERAAERG